jgi:hypothetical protein
MSDLIKTLTYEHLILLLMILGGVITWYRFWGKKFIERVNGKMEKKDWEKICSERRTECNRLVFQRLESMDEKISLEMGHLKDTIQIILGIVEGVGERLDKFIKKNGGG